MNMKKTDLVIFLDLDGVMADFDLHLKTEGKREENGKTKWDALDEAWWTTMPPVSGARDFYDTVKSLATVKFLTAPVLSEECFSGKAIWIQRFLPEKGKNALLDLIICPSKDKHFLAKSNHILVDDRQNNVDDWNKAGGIGILFDGDFSAVLKQIETVMKREGHVPAIRPLKP